MKRTVAAPRVLHYVATLRGGGAETLVRELLPRLRQREVEVAAFSAYDPRLTDDELDALPYRLFKGDKHGRSDVGFALRSVRAIRNFHPNVVHTHTITGKYWGRASAIAAGVARIVHTEHSPQAQLARWEPPFTRALTRRTDAFVTFSERTAAFISEREPVPRLEIIPNGINVDRAPTAADRLRARAALRAEHDVVVIGIVANLYPQKNQQLAIWALFGLPERIRSRARLDLFGAGPDEAHLRALAAELGVTAHVRFWGFRADVREMLAGLDILLTVAKVEAAPISLLEAMAAGLPIIAAPHHGALDLITDELSGLITKDWSVDGMTRALGRALADATWRARAGAWGRRRLLSEFNIETVADRHAALYRRLLRNN